MGRRSRSTSWPGVSQLRRRIERWRRQRTKRSPMPEELWESAASFSRRHGVGPIARALGIDYGALKKRATADLRDGRKTRQLSTEFVELGPGQLLGHAEPAGMVVELTDGNGAKLVMRVPTGNGVDVERLAESFWSHRG